MQRAGIDIAKIHTALCINAQHDQHAITWTKADVRSAFGVRCEDYKLDAENLHEWLKLRTDQQGLTGGVAERAGRMSSCYFELEGAHAGELALMTFHQRQITASRMWSPPIRVCS